MTFFNKNGVSVFESLTRTAVQVGSEQFRIGRWGGLCAGVLLTVSLFLAALFGFQVGRPQGVFSKDVAFREQPQTTFIKQSTPPGPRP